MGSARGAYRSTPLHLAIVSYPSSLDATLESIAQTLARGVDERHVVERAQRASDVRHHVRTWSLRDRRIERLSVIGHGAPGKMHVGDEGLFTSPDTDALLSTLVEHLAPGAQVHLLACGLMRDAAHGAVLLEFGRQLGTKRTVLAPTRALHAHDFSPTGLTRRAAQCLTAVNPTRRQHGGR